MRTPWAFRISKRERQLIEMAATQSGSTMSEWVRGAITQAALAEIKKGDDAVTSSPRDNETVAAKQRSRLNVKQRATAGASV